VSNIFNNNKASNAKIGQNVNKAGGFFARCLKITTTQLTINNIFISILFDFRI
jgi:hypothetical protein